MRSVDVGVNEGIIVFAAQSIDRADASFAPISYAWAPFSLVVRQPKHDFLSNLAVEVPQWVLIDLISRDHVESESEGCQAGTLGHFSEIDDLYGTRKPFFT